MNNTMILHNNLRLVRRFLVTGETRCPLTCVWTLETTSSTATIDPDKRRPAFWSHLLGRAIHLALTSFRYDSPALAS